MKNSRNLACRNPSKDSSCTCTDCNISFGAVKRNETNHCTKCREYETSVYYYGEEPRRNSSANKEINTVTSDHFSELDMDMNTTENKPYFKFNKNVLLATVNVDVNVAENEKDATETHNVETHIIGANNSQKGMSNTTAHLSAQIMNLSYKDYKESVSVEKTHHSVKRLSNANDIFKKIKEAYEACTCKICECLIGKSLPSPDKLCDCEPCNCVECTKYRKGLTNTAVDPRVIPLLQLEKTENEVIQSKRCDCKPCECITCGESSARACCSCKPCQCVECKSMVAHRTKTIIVAPMEEGTQRAHCLCSPCDCARCTHRGLNLSPNRVHEMSTGINRHPNCRCEACMNEACEPNGTDSCRCETRRGIMSKPFDRNPHDFNIHRATVSVNPTMKNTRNLKTHKTFSIYAVDTTHFPLKTKSNKQKCTCSACECIVCQCKDADMTNVKTPHICDRNSLKTIKIPNADVKSCKCSPCDCNLCSSGKQTYFGEPMTKGCECKICDCLYCEEAPQLKNDSSKILPLSDTCRTQKCDCRPICTCNSSHRTFKGKHGEINYINDDKLFDDDLYPIQNREFQRSSIIKNDCLSEPELLSKSSEYTELKHSRGQSNVFKNQASAHTISKQNLTIYHVIPERKFEKSFCKSEMPLREQNNLDFTSSNNSDDKRHDSFENGKEDKDLTEFYYASTSKSSSSGAKLEAQDHHYTRNNVLESVITACLKDGMDPSTCYKSQTPSLLSIPLSTHNLLNLSNSSLTYSRKSHQLTISSPTRNVDRSSGLMHGENNKNYIMNLLEYDYDGIRSTPKYKVKQCGCNICQCCGSCDDQHDINKTNTNEITQTLYDTNYIENNDCFLRGRFENYFKSNLFGKSDSAVEKNRCNRSLNRKEDDSQNKYCPWKAEYGNPRAFSMNTIDELLPRKSAPYERALITLQKAKDFSIELGRLLEKYERANLEFESISKKLKQSHDKVFNNFYYNSRNARSSDYVSQTREFKNNTDSSTPLCKKVNNINKSMPLIVGDARKPVNKTESISKIGKYGEKFAFINDITADKSIGTITSDSLRSSCLNYSDKFQSNASNILTNNSYEIKTAINCAKNPVAGLSCQKPGKSIIDNNDKPSDDMKVAEKYYNIYRKLIERTAHIAKITETDFGQAESQTLDCNMLKKLIKQEMKTLVKQLCDIEKKSKSGNAFGDETRVSNILAVVEELKAQDILALDTVQDISTKTKSAVNLIEQSKIEVKNLAKVSSTQKTETPVREPLRCLDSLPATPVINKGNTEKHLRDPLRCLNSLPTTPVIHNIDKGNTEKIELEVRQCLKDSKKPIGPTVQQDALSSPEVYSISKSKTSKDDMKVCVFGVRRVSDHTVRVKWEKPKVANDVLGYEILVDGRPVQNILNPEKCMAIITCLPHTEKVLLSIRTIANNLSGGPRPCSTIVYRPRSKSRLSII